MTLFSPPIAAAGQSGHRHRTRCQPCTEVGCHSLQKWAPPAGRCEQAGSCSSWHINCVCNSVLHRTERATKLGSTCEAADLRRSSAKWSAEETLLLFFSEARWCWLRKPLIYMLCLLKLCSQHFCWIPARLLRWVWALCFLGAGSNCTVPVISVPNHEGLRSGVGRTAGIADSRRA